MSETAIFNGEIKKYLESNNDEVVTFINKKFNESRSQNYYGFFDSFMYEYGIISFNANPLLNRNEYIPYINCTRNNVFLEEKGITELSSKTHSLKDCQRIFAKYFISKLKKVDVNIFIEWNSENNYGLN